MIITRKFKALVDDHGLGDIGMSGLTAGVRNITVGVVYSEHWSWSPERGDVPSGHVIDDLSPTWICDTISEIVSDIANDREILANLDAFFMIDGYDDEDEDEDDE